MNFSDAIKSEGYGFAITPVEWSPENGFKPMGGYRPLGEPNCHVIVCETESQLDLFVIVAPSDTWDHAYSAAHEIAEHRHGFKHTDSMWAEQCMILSRWCKMLARDN